MGATVRFIQQHMEGGEMDILKAAHPQHPDILGIANGRNEESLTPSFLCNALQQYGPIYIPKEMLEDQQVARVAATAELVFGQIRPETEENLQSIGARSFLCGLQNISDEQLSCLRSSWKDAGLSFLFDVGGVFKKDKHVIFAALNHEPLTNVVQQLRAIKSPLLQDRDIFELVAKAADRNNVETLLKVLQEHSPELLGDREIEDLFEDLFGDQEIVESLVAADFPAILQALDKVNSPLLQDRAFMLLFVKAIIPQVTYRYDSKVLLDILIKHSPHLLEDIDLVTLLIELDIRETFLALTEVESPLLKNKYVISLLVKHASLYGPELILELIERGVDFFGYPEVMDCLGCIDSKRVAVAVSRGNTCRQERAASKMAVS